MPRFLKSSDPSLSTLNKVKKRVKKFQKQSPLNASEVLRTDESVPPSGTTNTSGDTGLLSNVGKLEIALDELTNYIELYRQQALRASRPSKIPNISNFGDKVSGLSQEIKGLIKSISGSLVRQKYSFANYSSAEVSAVKSELRSIRKNFDFLKRTLVDLADWVAEEQDVDLFGQQAVAVQGLFAGVDISIEGVLSGLSALIPLLEDTIGNYQGLRTPVGRRNAEVGAGYNHAKNVFGEHLKSLTGDGELLTTGYRSRPPLIPLCQAYAPRNTFDLPNLPRRYL
jgi:hypothetical protein